MIATFIFGSTIGGIIGFTIAALLHLTADQERHDTIYVDTDSVKVKDKQELNSIYGMRATTWNHEENEEQE